MKSKIVKNIENESLYPKLKYRIWSNNEIKIILFIRENSGMVVYSTDEYNPLGQYSDKWCEKKYIDFNGEVILQN